MNNCEIKLIISDFDGTLVDTFDANYYAYKAVLDPLGYPLSKELYKNSFGLRLEEFLKIYFITDPQLINEIRNKKAEVYPLFFDKIKVNSILLNFIRAFRQQSKYVALASTARRNNIQNVLLYIGATADFDYMVTGEDISQSKPSAECYLKAMDHFSVLPKNTLIFEDSNVGIEAAIASGASYIRVNEFFYGF